MENNNSNITNEDYSDSEKIYHKPLCLIPSLVFCWPLGLGLLWTSNVKQNIKVISTVIIGFLVLIGIPINSILIESLNENIDEVQQEFPYEDY